MEQFDVTGPFDFAEQIQPLEELRTIALDTRPDLKAAVQAVDKAKTDHQLAVANGSTDPTFSAWYSHNPSFANPFANDTVGGSVSIPLRIFDRNQGEKLRTQLDIGRNERLRDANAAQVFSDVDSAYATLISNLTLLRPYKTIYLEQAVSVRDTISFRLSARRRVAAGFSECAAGLPQHSTELSEPGWFVSDRRQSIESGGGPRGDSQ